MGGDDEAYQPSRGPAYGLVSLPIPQSSVNLTSHTELTAEWHSTSYSTSEIPSNALPNTRLNMTGIFLKASTPDRNSIDGSSGTVASGLVMADVYILLVNESMLSLPRKTFTLAERSHAFHGDLRFGMQVYNASVHKGMYVESEVDFMPGNWTFLENGPTYLDKHQWSLYAKVAGVERQVNINYSAFLGFGGLVQSMFTGVIKDSQNTTATSVDVTLVVQSGYQYSDKNMGTDNVCASTAKSLTDLVRTATNGTAEGSTHQLVPYMKARWWFMIPPLVMVILNSDFVIATTLQSRRRGIASWKTSALTNIFTDYYTQSSGAARKLTHDVVIGPDGCDRLSDLGGWAGIRNASLRQEREYT